MTNQQFLQQFGHFIEAPNGVEKLREIIYALAAAGRLIESEDKTKYELGDIADFVMGQAPPGNECNKDGVGTIFVKTGEFGSLYPEVREWTTKPLKKAKDGDILICVVGATIGKLNLAIDCAIGRSVAAIRPCDGVDTKFLYISLMPYVLRLRAQSRGSAQGTITKTELNSVEIRVPPLPEQHRIVAKVDELMSLCDQMEAERNNREATHKRLIRAVHHPLTEANDTTTGIDILTAWHRIRDNFADLYTTLESVQALRQTILQLAVQGKLVPQLSNEEPASGISEEISKEGIIKKKSKSVNTEAIKRDEAPFSLPHGWEWSRLGNLLEAERDISYGIIKLGDEPKSGGVKTLRCSDVRFRKILSHQARTVTNDLSEEYSRTILKGGEILMNIRGTLGGCGIVTDELIGFNVAREVAVIPVHASLHARYVLDVISSPLIQENTLSSLRGIAYKGLNLGLLREFLIPIPPRNEQHRIVAKVDELMALCDQLEGNIRAKSDTATCFAEAIVQQISAA